MANSANFSNIYKFYDFINKLITLGFDAVWRKRAINKITGNKVLDLGSGTGASFNLLKAFDVTAIDPDENMLRLNKFNNKIVGKAELLPFEDNSFDCVISTFVWRNLDNPKKSLEEVRRVLKPEGNFILLDMTRPKNKLKFIIHFLGTYLLTNLIGILTMNLKEYQFLHKSLDKYPQPEKHLEDNPFMKFKISRMGLFGFVYLAEFTD